MPTFKIKELCSVSNVGLVQSLSWCINKECNITLVFLAITGNAFRYYDMYMHYIDIKDYK